MSDYGFLDLRGEENNVPGDGVAWFERDGTLHFSGWACGHPVGRLRLLLFPSDSLASGRVDGSLCVGYAWGDPDDPFLETFYCFSNPLAAIAFAKKLCHLTPEAMDLVFSLFREFHNPMDLDDAIDLVTAQPDEVILVASALYEDGGISVRLAIEAAARTLA